MPLYLPQRGGDIDGAKPHCQSTEREELKMKNGVGIESAGIWEERAFRNSSELSAANFK